MMKNNADMEKEAPFSIWLGNLKAYTEGDLDGEWLELPMKEEELWEKVGTVIKNPNEEEPFIADIDLREDCLYMKEIISEWSSVKDLNTVAKLIGYERHPKVEAFLMLNPSLSIPELANTLMQEEKIPFYRYEFDGSNNSKLMDRLTAEEKMGYTIIDAPQIRKLLESTPLGEADIYTYIDVAAVGRDAGINNYQLTDEGYIDIRISGPDLSLYTMEEIREEIREQEKAVEVQEKQEESQKEKVKPQQKPDILPSL